MALNDIQQMEAALFGRSLYEGKLSEVPPNGIAETKNLLSKLSDICKSNGFDRAVSAVLLAEDHLGQLPLDGTSFSVDAVHAELRAVREAVSFELFSHKFVKIQEQYGEFIEQDALFGDSVRSAFPSATYDIREFGNCIAVGCSTAAVFHLMRAVEWGIRALCVDLGFRRLRVKNKRTGKITYIALGWTDWETTLNQLKLRVTERITKTKRGAKKQLYQEFYYPALQDIEAIKDAWRNHVMHTRREYTPEDAAAVLSHVKRLMVKLASRVSEC